MRSRPLSHLIEALDFVAFCLRSGAGLGMDGLRLGTKPLSWGYGRVEAFGFWGLGVCGLGMIAILPSPVLLLLLLQALFNICCSE